MWPGRPRGRRRTWRGSTLGRRALGRSAQLPPRPSSLLPLSTRTAPQLALHRAVEEEAGRVKGGVDAAGARQRQARRLCGRPARPQRWRPAGTGPGRAGEAAHGRCGAGEWGAGGSLRPSAVPADPSPADPPSRAPARARSHLRHQPDPVHPPRHPMPVAPFLAALPSRGGFARGASPGVARYAEVRGEAREGRRRFSRGQTGRPLRRRFD